MKERRRGNQREKERGREREGGRKRGRKGLGYISENTIHTRRLKSPFRNDNPKNELTTGESAMDSVALLSSASRLHPLDIPRDSLSTGSSLSVAASPRGKLVHQERTRRLYILRRDILVRSVTARNPSRIRPEFQPKPSASVPSLARVYEEEKVRGFVGISRDTRGNIRYARVCRPSLVEN